MSVRSLLTCLGLLGALAAVAPLRAHVSPPVILLSERDALATLAPGATQFAVKELRLSAAQRADIRKQFAWRADEPVYRLHVGSDAAGRMLAVVVFVAESTAHGRVRAAVAVGPDGRVREARVAEATEESLVWLRPLIDQGLPREFIGHGCHDAFNVAERFKDAGNMRRFYAQVVASLVQRGAILFDVAGLASRTD